MYRVSDMERVVESLVWNTHGLHFLHDRPLSTSEMVAVSPSHARFYVGSNGRRVHPILQGQPSECVPDNAQILKSSCAMIGPPGGHHRR